MSKRLGILAALVAIVIGVWIFTGGGSSDHSSEWSSYQVGKAESDTAAELSSPTKGQVECIVNGIKSFLSPDEAYETLSADDQEKVEKLNTECLENPSDDEEPYEEDYEYQNEGLNELNEERQQEIEQEEAEGLVTPESSNP